MNRLGGNKIWYAKQIATINAYFRDLSFYTADDAAGDPYDYIVAVSYADGQTDDINITSVPT